MPGRKRKGRSGGAPPQLYGYIRDDEWLFQYALKHNLVPTTTSPIAAGSEALWHIINKARIAGKQTIGVVYVNGRAENIITLGHNQTLEAMKPPEAALERLQSVLGTSGPPKWYFYRRKDSISLSPQSVEDQKVDTLQ